jgi:hypothetical protein
LHALLPVSVPFPSIGIHHLTQQAQQVVRLEIT